MYTFYDFKRTLGLGYVLVPPLAALQVHAAQTEQALENVVVTATRVERELRDVPMSISVIDSETVEQQLMRDIRDLVRYEPGVSVSGSGRFGLDGFTIRGIGGDRVLTQVDGLQVADAFSFGPFLSARRDFIDVDAVKRAEIIRGPASSLYGSDALGGVVSFITKDPADFLAETGDPLYASVKTGFSSADESLMGTATAAGRSGDVSGLLLYTYRSGEETETQGRRGGTGAARGEADPLDQTARNFLGKIVYEPGAHHRFRLTGELLEDEVDSDVLSDAGEMVRGVLTLSSRGEDARERRRIGLGYEYSGSTGIFDALTLSVDYQESETRQLTVQRRSDRAGEVERIRDSLFAHDETALSAQFDKSLRWGATRHYLVYGAEYKESDNRNLRDGGSTLIATGTVLPEFSPLPTRDFPITETTEAAVYIQDEITLAGERLRITPGLRYDRYELDPQVDGLYESGNPGVPAPEDFSDSEISAKLGAVFHFNDSFSLYGQYAQGFRAPPYDDVNVGFTNLIGGYTTLPNSELESETSDSYEIGLRGQGDTGSFRAAIYYNDYDNFIESLSFKGFNPMTGLIEFQARNREQVVIKGAEFQGHLRLGALWPRLEDVSLYSSIAYAHGQDESTDRPLNSVEPVTAVLGLAYAPTGADWDAELVLTAVDEKDRVDHSDAAAEFFVPPHYVTLDLLAEYRLGDRARLNAGIFNITDKKYWAWGDVTGFEDNDPALQRLTRPGINVSISLHYRF